MDGVRWTQEQLDAFTARRATLKVVPATPALVSADAPRPKRKIQRPEQALQIEAIKFLDVALPPSWRVFHVPNGGARSAVEASIFKAMGVRAGVGDLAFVGRGGRFAGGEAKAGKNGLTEDQSEWRDWCLANEIPWFMFRSIDELVSGCVDAGIPLRVRQ